MRATDAAPLLELPTGEALPFPRTPGAPAFEAVAPQFGEHTRPLLAEAGLRENEIAALLEAGEARAAGRAEG